MIKLWKVTVNNWGWDCPRTYYFRSRKEAEQFAQRFPASDPVQYAGRFTANKAAFLEVLDN